MAQRHKPRQQPTADSRAPTRRVVLERVIVALVPEELLDRTPQAISGGDLDGAQVREAWIERDVVPGDRQQDAIRAYVKPGTPEQRTGTFRAVAESAWRGGRSYRQPELVPVKEEALE